jgi:hypothetical protein
MGKDSYGSGRGLIDVIFLHLSPGTEEIYETYQAWQTVSRSEFDPSTSRVRVKRITAKLTSSVRRMLTEISQTVLIYSFNDIVLTTECKIILNAA